MVRIRSLVSTGWGHHIWGRSSLGRALGWQSRGSQFDPDRLHQLGVWPSLVGRLDGVQEVAGSNPVIPTKYMKNEMAYR